MATCTDLNLIGSARVGETTNATGSLNSYECLQGDNAPIMAIHAKSGATKKSRALCQNAVYWRRTITMKSLYNMHFLAQQASASNPTNIGTKTVKGLPEFVRESSLLGCVLYPRSEVFSGSVSL